MKWLLDLGESTHNMEILVMGIEIDTIKSRWNGTQCKWKTTHADCPWRKWPIMAMGCSRSKDLESIMGLE
jgi:hypothetical protein